MDNAVDWDSMGNKIEWFCNCKCGQHFKSRIYFDFECKKLKEHITQEPCPQCGANDNLVRASSHSDSEAMTIGGE